MAEATLVVKIDGLEVSLQGVAGLAGEPAADGNPGSGFAGAASLAASSPLGRLQDFATSLTRQMSGVLDFDASASLDGAAGMLGALTLDIQKPPTAALEGFAQRIATARTAFGGGWMERLQKAMGTVQGISAGVPSDRTAVLRELLDQILAVLMSLEGPEAQDIRAWTRTLLEMHRVLMPLLAKAQTLPDPASLVVQVIERALRSILEVFGVRRVQQLFKFLGRLPGEALAPVALAAVSGDVASLSATYDQCLAAAGGSYPEFRAAIVEADAALLKLKKRLRPILGEMRRIAAAKIFQPGALEGFLREAFEEALSVRIRDVQRIDKPFQSLFDRIDHAIDGLDLSAVRDRTLAFFQSTRAAIEQADLRAIADPLRKQLATVDGTLRELQQGITKLLAQTQAFFADLEKKIAALAATVGATGADDTFEYGVVNDLRSLLEQARAAIAGDPQDPQAPSVAKSLSELGTAVDQSLTQLQALLEPLAGGISNTAQTAAEGLQAFSGFLQELDLPARIQALQGEVAKMLDALGTLDVDALADPVIAVIEENTAKLRSIDPASIDDTVRTALSVALDVVINIDFSVTISAPLAAQLAEVKAVPAQAVGVLQKVYEQALARLDALQPERLLAGLLAPFDVLGKAVGPLDAAGLLEPLDHLHQQHLQEPLAGLDPAALLQPLQDAFAALHAATEKIRGAAVLAPLQSELSALKTEIAGFDVTGWIGDLLAALDKVKQDLREIRPSDLLHTLEEDFARLEAALDRFKPSVLFQPAVDLAAPLLGFLEGIQQQTIDALFQLFRGPLEILDRLRPEALAQEIGKRIDAILEPLTALDLPTAYQSLKARHFDLQAGVSAPGLQMQASLTALVDPRLHLDPFIETWTELIAALQGVKQNVQAPSLAGLYDELRPRLLDLLPPYARELLDPETFKRIMRLADPTRFLPELDARFEALKNKLVPIRPQEIAAELDAAYESVLALVEGLDVTASLGQIRDTVQQIQSTARDLRIDFGAGDIDQALASLRTRVSALDPAKLIAALGALHQDVVLAVESTLPSKVLSGLGAALGPLKQAVAAVDPRALLVPPLEQAWQPLQEALAAIDFTAVLAPLVDRLDELEASFLAALKRAEDAFETMLSTARTAVSGGASVQVEVSLG
jgi:hypothetical protein